MNIEEVIYKQNELMLRADGKTEEEIQKNDQFLVEMFSILKKES